MLTKEDMKQVRKDHDDAYAEADRQRALAFAQADAEGLAQKDVIDATGYSRETVRRITREGQRLLAEQAPAEKGPAE
ncbi:hypothetical protein [Streptomyces sp. NPDC020983]|uniref:hypothetical protein n=1 Tax=Streptomyces sp. NPDC020983 TaxID=3365106 RepID=UPI0037AFC161